MEKITLEVTEESLVTLFGALEHLGLDSACLLADRNGQFLSEKEIRDSLQGDAVAFCNILNLEVGGFVPLLIQGYISKLSK